MSRVFSSNWHRKVQYRWTCAECQERTMCAVVKRKNGKADLRLCETCYADGHWHQRP